MKYNNELLASSFITYKKKNGLNSSNERVRALKSSENKDVLWL